MCESYRLPPVNLDLIDDSGAFKEQARDTRRHFEKVNAELNRHDKYTVWLNEVRAAAWDEAVDWLSRHYEDMVPTAVERMDKANPYRNGDNHE